MYFLELYNSKNIKHNPLSLLRREAQDHVKISEELSSLAPSLGRTLYVLVLTLRGFNRGNYIPDSVKARTSLVLIEERGLCLRTLFHLSFNLKIDIFSELYNLTQKIHPESPMF